MATKNLKGGAALERKLNELAKKLSKPRTLAVGFLEGATYPNKENTPVAMVAAIQEFGSAANNIPPRPFFRDMIAAESPQWGSDLGSLLKRDGYDPKAALASMGKVIQGQLQKSIIETTSPPNAPSTIARKGFATPLIDTGHMMNSVDSEVSE